MLPSEEIDHSMCLPNAIIDAMRHLGIQLTDENVSRIYNQRTCDIVFIVEESLQGKRFVDEVGNPRSPQIAAYELESTRDVATQFECIVTTATLSTVEEFLAHTTQQERVLAKVRVREQNHVEHVLWKGSDGGIVGNSRRFDP